LTTVFMGVENAPLYIYRARGQHERRRLSAVSIAKFPEHNMLCPGEEVKTEAR
jgi:hypothetical protein